MPSPENEEMVTRSPVTSRSSTRATAPLVSTASLRACCSNTRRPSRRTETSSIIRRSMPNRPPARRASRDSSQCSSSAMNPMLPRFTPRMGMFRALASWAAWRMVPSPPKHTSTSASSSSSSIWPRAAPAGRSSRLPWSTSKGRQMAVWAPAFSRMRWAAWAARSPRSR